MSRTTLNASSTSGLVIAGEICEHAGFEKLQLRDMNQELIYELLHQSDVLYTSIVDAILICLPANLSEVPKDENGKAGLTLCDCRKNGLQYHTVEEA
jgi:hypothetical protein